MKKHLILTLGLAVLATPFALHALTPNAHAYASVVADPKNGNGNLSGDVETKSIVKSATAGSSEALIAGLVVGYDATANDGYTVTRAVTQDQRGQNTLACVVVDTIATGDTTLHRCITKGFARVKYDGSVTGRPIEAGRKACVDAGGKVRGCYLASAVEATANTGIVPLRSNTNTGDDLPVMINLE